MTTKELINAIDAWRQEGDGRRAVVCRLYGLTESEGGAPSIEAVHITGGSDALIRLALTNELQEGVGVLCEVASECCGKKKGGTV